MLNEDSSRIVLPPAPATESSDGVAAWSQPVDIDSYLPADPDQFPAYLDRRVYQGSSGKVFPLPFFERIAGEKVTHSWQALHLENRWIRIMILPELGGRIHIAYDKVGDYDLFYRNNVIKPALVGLAGPWISGGVEFNWPQHHRPATFLPVDWEIERASDGSVTIWCSDHDPFTRMKGMHGIRLRPDSSVIEARVRLYNRSDSRQSFLWWANVAAAVGDEYQSFFPRDVEFVADHARRAITRFPHADRPYYGVDYPAKAGTGDGDRIDWYRNIPVPTSYMVTSTDDEFFGGYDHGRERGFIHWASKAVAPGKKQWTWGNAPFGWAWDANLTDTDGPYVELMAGVYTDNQPDFAFIGPGETKTFSQYWYPIRETGPAHAASRRGSLSVSTGPEFVVLAINVTEELPASVVLLTDSAGVTRFEQTVDLTPDRPTLMSVPISELNEPVSGTLAVRNGNSTVVSMVLAQPSPRAEPPTAIEPESPDEIATIDELVHVATYLDQYRHATRKSAPYWREILTRDPGESRALLALGQAALNQGLYGEARANAEASIARTTKWAPTPATGAAHYLLGRSAARLGDREQAIAAFSRAAWDNAYFAAASFELARQHSLDGEHETATAVLEAVVSQQPDRLQAAALLALLLRRLDRHADADRVLQESLRRDRLDAWTRHLVGLTASDDPTIVLDVALEYRSAGFLREALDAMREVQRVSAKTAQGQVNVLPLALAYQLTLALEIGGTDAATAAATAFESAELRWCLPSRLDDVDVLLAAVPHLARAGKAHALLGHWFYDVGRFSDAIEQWELALTGGSDENDIAVVHRNLGIASYNTAHDADAAIGHYRLAMQHLPGNPKLLYEFDQLSQRAGASSADRLDTLTGNLSAVLTRDDLTVSYSRLLLDVGRVDDALDILASRPFQPWEGGEGKVLDVWEDACVAYAAAAVATGHPQDAVEILARALVPPANLGESRHPLANRAQIHLAMGDAYAAAGQRAEAELHWHEAARQVGDFSSMAPVAFSDRTIYSILAMRRLGMSIEADRELQSLRAWLAEFGRAEATVDFFATSLPEMLLFVDDPAVERDRLVARITRQLDRWSSPS